MKTFGKPDRLLTCECERSESTTLAQAFQMINGETVRGKLEKSSNRIGKCLDAGQSDSDILEEVYLAALAREPTQSERAGVTAHIGRRRIAARPGKTWSGRYSIARSSCFAIDWGLTNGARLP